MAKKPSDDAPAPPPMDLRSFARRVRSSKRKTTLTVGLCDGSSVEIPDVEIHIGLIPRPCDSFDQFVMTEQQWEAMSIACHSAQLRAPLLPGSKPEPIATEIREPAITQAEREAARRRMPNGAIIV